MTKKGQYAHNVLFSTVFQADDGPTVGKNGVIRNKTELQKALPHHALILTSSVDFETEQLIFVALGLRDGGGRDAQINAVSYLGDRDSGLPSLTQVSYRENINCLSGAGGAENSNPTCPMHVTKMKKLDGETVFDKSEKN
jgi:hypothetical protein